MTLFTRRPATDRSTTARRQIWTHRTRVTRQQRAAEFAQILIAERARRAAAKTKETPC